MIDPKESHADLIKRLKDPNEADLYFLSILQKCKKLDKEASDKLLREALNNLAQANPDEVNIDVKDKNLKMSVLLRFLHFISKKDKVIWLF